MEWTQEAQNHWEVLNEALQRSLMSEIELRQEILCSLNQQEYVLLIGDVKLKEELHRECTKIAKELKWQAKERNGLMRKMMELTSSVYCFDEFEDLFHSDREEEAETLLLYQKVQALTEKIHDQKIRNKMLYVLIKQGGSLNIRTPLLKAQPVYPKGKEKKPLLITIDYPEKEVDSKEMS